MGLLDILNGMQNGPHGPSHPTTQQNGGMSPMTMAILALLAWKAVKHFSQGNQQHNAAPAPVPPPQPTGGSVALGHTECDVVRGIGAPDSVNLSSGPGGERVAVVTWSRGARAGIYTFSSGRLTSVERGPDAAPEPKPAKPKKKPKKPATTSNG